MVSTQYANVLAPIIIFIILHVSILMINRGRRTSRHLRYVFVQIGGLNIVNLLVSLFTLELDFLKPHIPPTLATLVIYATFLTTGGYWLARNQEILRIEIAVIGCLGMTLALNLMLNSLDLWPPYGNYLIAACGLLAILKGIIWSRSDISRITAFFRRLAHPRPRPRITRH